MSYDTDRTYVYIYSGKKIRLYKIVRSSGRIIDNQGRVTGGLLDEIIYPDESITNGLRIEFTKIVEPFVVEDPETTSSLTEDSNPSESSHLNLNRVLSLAVVCYVKAQLAERMGNMQLKEYYMKEFYKKVADNESNKNKVFMASPIKTFAVK
jgi:hypothetical protein|tara:strand:- start:34298 stop:34753 length:456 start_codon:yes stop_codon:yes gene_type:complete